MQILNFSATGEDPQEAFEDLVNSINSSATIFDEIVSVSHNIVYNEGNQRYYATAIIDFRTLKE